MRLFRERFPKDFMFQLSKDQFESLRLQSVTSSWGSRRTPTEDRTVRLGTQQVITGEIEALERSACSRTCLDVAIQDIAPLFPVGKTIYENLEAL